MGDIYFQTTLLLLVILVPMQYLVYKKQAGFKNEPAAKVVLARGGYGILVYACLVGFQLVQWNPTIEFILSIVGLIAGLIALYFLQRYLEKSSVLKTK